MEEQFAQAIRGFFEQNGWQFQEEDGAFYSAVQLPQTSDGALLRIVTDGVGVTVSAALDRHLPEESLMDLIQAANLTNFLLSTGSMYIDLSERYAAFRIGALYTKAPAATEDVADQVEYAIEMVERIALGLVGIGEGGWDVPKLVQTIMEFPEDEDA